MYECYSNGRQTASHSNGDIASKSSELWSSLFSESSGDVPDGTLFNYEVSSGQTCKPVFMSLDLETPLGFSCFLANTSH